MGLLFLDIQGNIGIGGVAMEAAFYIQGTSLTVRLPGELDHPA